MTRREAIEYDNALKDAMKQVSLQYGMGESVLVELFLLELNKVLLKKLRI